MRQILTLEENIQYEKAIKFLVDEYSKSGHNPKPVILHSLRLAFYLLEIGYQGKIISAAILHDLLEDSDVTQEEITRNFGKPITDFVSSLSFNPKISNKDESYQETFQRTLQKGKDALIIKCADIYDNSFYFELANREVQNYLLRKINYFLDLSKPEIGNEPVWQDLNKQYLLKNEFFKQQ